MPGIGIINAPIGAPQYVGHKHAERWVRQGRAAWSDGRLRLSAPMVRAMETSLRPGGQGYDQVVRPMTARERRAIPVVGGSAGRRVVAAHGRTAAEVAIGVGYPLHEG